MMDASPEVKDVLRKLAAERDFLRAAIATGDSLEYVRSKLEKLDG